MYPKAPTKSQTMGIRLNSRRSDSLFSKTSKSHLTNLIAKAHGMNGSVQSPGVVLVVNNGRERGNGGEDSVSEDDQIKRKPSSVREILQMLKELEVENRTDLKELTALATFGRVDGKDASAASRIEGGAIISSAPCSRKGDVFFTRERESIISDEMDQATGLHTRLIDNYRPWSVSPTIRIAKTTKFIRDLPCLNPVPKDRIPRPNDKGITSDRRIRNANYVNRMAVALVNH